MKENAQFNESISEPASLTVFPLINKLRDCRRVQLEAIMLLMHDITTFYKITKAMTKDKFEVQVGQTEMDKRLFDTTAVVEYFPEISDIITHCQNTYLFSHTIFTYNST